jgi:hypothetical protein
MRRHISPFRFRPSLNTPTFLPSPDFLNSRSHLKHHHIQGSWGLSRKLRHPIRADHEGSLCSRRPLLRILAVSKPCPCPERQLCFAKPEGRTRP